MDGYIGQIIMFAGNFAPRNWAFCSGQLLPISQYTAVFSIIGTTYGGDGRTTFGLPDLRGRAPIHVGTGPGLTTKNLGQRSGQEYVTLTQLDMPAHYHAATFTPDDGGGPVSLMATTENGDSRSPSTGAVLGTTNQGINGNNLYKTDPNPNNLVDLGGISGGGGSGGTVTVHTAGGSQGHNNMQPYLTVNFIMCLVGIYPSRS